jgi:guanylate kinase
MQSFLKKSSIMLIISSPSGAGKSSLAKQLQMSENNINISISFTTRQKRSEEDHGKDYYFINEECFREMIADNQFIEYAEVYGNYYGTPKYSFSRSDTQNNDIIFDVDWQGARALKEEMPEDVVSIYILPPSIEELEKRLRNREQDAEDVIQKRMLQAVSEMKHYVEYDYVIVNDDFADSLSKLKSILHAERLKRARQENLSDFVATLR